MGASNSYQLVPNVMMWGADRIFSKDIYDALDPYQDFKDKEDFITKRKIWHSYSLKTKRLLMIVANIQNASKKVYSWQYESRFEINKIDKNLHIITRRGKSLSHGRYSTIINIIDKGEKGYFIHADDVSKKDSIGKIKETFSMFVMDYIEEYEKNCNDKISYANKKELYLYDQWCNGDIHL